MNYYLGLEGTRKIFLKTAVVSAFLSLRCVSQARTRQLQWMAQGKIGKDITINGDDLFIEGERAGANAIVTILFHNASKNNTFQIPIRAALPCFLAILLQ
jgi:hypothetical protein